MFSRIKVSVLSLSVFVLFLALPIMGIAQQDIVKAATVSDRLPDAPVPQQDDSTYAQNVGTASVSGTVLDPGGAVISGAQVSLVLPDGKTQQTVKSGANGQFSFAKIPAGSYLVLINAVGFAPFQSNGFTLSEQQVYVVPEIKLAVAGSMTTVVVRPQEVIAAEQIKAEEKQRILGVLPNFYTSFIANPAPLTSNQKLSLVAHDEFDWTQFAIVSMIAGMEQANNAHAGYGQGAAGYGKRWGAAFADNISSDLLGRYVFASLFHQDPRYFYQGTGTKKSRFLHALSYAFVARSDSGKTMPNYAYLFGDLCSGALSNAYYPRADRGASLVFTNAAIGIAGLAGFGIIQEFFGRKMTSHVPSPTH